jgi:hypothetical protein
MERRFGHDFSRVRVHADSQAAESARAVHAVAYTVGSDIVFGEGAYSPCSAAGQRLLAHELTHVVQQAHAAGPVVFEPDSASYAGAEREADAMASSLDHGATSWHSQVRPLSRALQRLDVEDCSADHEAAIRAAARAAGPAIRQTISAILGSPRTPAAEAALNLYFGASAPRYAANIALRLAIIASRIPGATIECENPDSIAYDFFCGGALAYVRPVPAFFGVANIHVCQPGFQNQSATERMGTIVHEAAHRFIDADDEAYYGAGCTETGETAALSDSDRRDNADSYACLVQTLG